MFLFLYYSWPELIRIIFQSRILNKNYFLFDRIDDKILNKLFSIKDNCTYNRLFSLDEKIFILEKLIQISLDSVFIRSFLKETQEKRLLVKKKQRELEEELKIIEIKKKEIDKKYIAVKPEKKIEEMNKKLEKIKNSENPERNTRNDYSKVKKKLEEDIERYKNYIKYVKNFNENRKLLLSKIDKVKDELLNININEKKYLGLDRYGNKYYYFSEQIFVKTKKIGNNYNINNKSNIEWRVINNTKALSKIIENLCDKAIHESELKTKLLFIYPKYVKHLARKPQIYLPIEEIFKRNVLLYENNKSIIKNLKCIRSYSSLISNSINDFSLFFIKICNIEKGVSDYLLYDNKQWEIEENKKKIKLWLKDVRDVKKYANLIIFLNDRFKNPYRINTDKEEKEYKFEENKRIQQNQNDMINANKNMNVINNMPNNNSLLNKNGDNTKNDNIIINKNDLLEDLKKDINDIKSNITNASENFNSKNIKSELKYNNNDGTNENKNKSIIKKQIQNKENDEVSVLYSKDLFNQDGNINLYFENNKNLQSYRTRLWSKDWEPYNIEYFFIKYVNMIQSFSSLYISITMLEIVLNSLVKRRDLCKKKMDMIKKKEIKEKNNKDKIKEINEIEEIKEIKEIKEPINKNNNIILHSKIYPYLIYIFK